MKFSFILFNLQHKMKNSALLLFALFICSCISKNNLANDNDGMRKYEMAYNAITHKMNQQQPFLAEYKSNASGVKIIPKLYRLRKYSIYGIDYFKNENSFINSGIIQLSKKYSQSNWRKDKNHRTLKIEELKKFHGPISYIYFSEIKNDSLRADILGNPFAQYEMTTGMHYLVIFKNDYIQSVQKTIGNYD